MDKQQATKRIQQYLTSHFIYFEKNFYEGIPQLTMIFRNCYNSPDDLLESCVWFYDNKMEARTYFNQKAANLCKEYQQSIPKILRLFNYINATVWMYSSDGAGNLLYAPNILYTPRLYMTEDAHFDITLTTIINYDFYELAPLETEDYITVYCPELLNKLSPAIFPLLLGEIDLQQAMQYIDNFTGEESN